MTGTLPQWCADIISSPPRSGEGFHNWLFRAARGLWKCGRHENDIREFLQNAAASCGRHVSDREILDAVRRSQSSAFQPIRAPHSPWPAVNHEQREAVIEQDSALSIFGKFRQSVLRITNRTRSN